MNSNYLQINTLTSVHQHVVTSTPLRKSRLPVSVTSSLPSPITPLVPSSTVKTGRGKAVRVGEAEKKIVSAQKDLLQAMVVPSCYEDLMKDDVSEKRRRSSRKLYTPKDCNTCDDEEYIVICSGENHSELKSSLSANLHGRSSNRVDITTTSRSTHYRRKPSGVKENAEDAADDKNILESSNEDEIKHQNNGVKRTSQEKETSKLQSDEIPDAVRVTSHMDVENVAGLRRSTRQRIKPLEYWRGERVHYKPGSDKCLEVAGVCPGYSSHQGVLARGRSVHYKKKRIQFPQEDTKETCARKLVSVPYGNGMCKLECYSTVRAEADVTECTEHTLATYTALEVPGMSTGYIELSPFCESCSGIDSNLVFHILAGTLTVTIHETTRNMTKGEFFFVPKGVSHTLKNVSKVKTLLIFTKYDD